MNKIYVLINKESQIPAGKFYYEDRDKAKDIMNAINESNRKLGFTNRLEVHTYENASESKDNEEDGVFKVDWDYLTKEM